MRAKKRPRDSTGRFLPQGSAFTRPASEGSLTPSQTQNGATAAIAVLPKEAASTRVLAISELHEMILLALPMRDLLLAQKVSKSWQSLVEKSVRLQRALFFAPAACGTVSYIDWRYDDKDMLTSLNLGEHLRGPNKDQLPVPYQAHWGRTRDDIGKYRVFLNPLLAKAFPFLGGKAIFEPDCYAKMSKAIRRPNASWRKMYFTQPPISLMVVETDSEDRESQASVGSRQQEWTVTTVTEYEQGRGMSMEELMEHLDDTDELAWVEGSGMWEEWTGPGDLEKVMAGGKEGAGVKTEDESA